MAHSPLAVTNYALPDGLDASGLHARLAGRLELEDDASRLVDRAYLDTFDGRVRGGGARRSGSRTVGWCCVDGDDRELAALDLPQASPAVWAADLPAGAMRDRLARVLDVRAATELARVRVRRRALRVLDGERKTVVRRRARGAGAGDRCGGRERAARRGCR